MQKILPFLWFNTEAEEAMNFYVSIFKNSTAGEVSRFGAAGPGPEGSVMSARFNLDGVEFVALNGGPQFHFTEAISFLVNCADQAEVDDLWDKLSAGGQPSQCGWLKDKFGVSWQIIPTILNELMTDPDPAKAQRATQAMLSMQKIDIAALKAAAEKS